jgi:hypothetical protein
LAGRFLNRRRWLQLKAEEFSAAVELELARAVGQEAKVTNAHEAVRQDMKQEAADELAGWQGHGASAVAMLSISVREGDTRPLGSLGNCEDAIVRKATR